MGEGEDPKGPAAQPPPPGEPVPESAEGGADPVEGGAPEGAPEAPSGRIELPEGLESTLPDDAPQIQLPLFEGPLDLLLYLIRRDKIDIHDLPIAPITRKYTEYLELMRELNLDIAGEFMVMAATLIHIKSKLLVPVEPNEAAGEEDAVDPREELIQRLLEFQRYKEAAGVLHQRAEIRAATWGRPDASVPRIQAEDGEEVLEASLFDLISAFKELLDRRKTLLAHEVELDERSVEERMEQMLDQLKEGDSLDFLALFESETTKPGMIVTFLALLELIRLKRVKVYQKGVFGPIRVFRPVGPELGPGPEPQPA